MGIIDREWIIINTISLLWYCRETDLFLLAILFFNKIQYNKFHPTAYFMNAFICYSTFFPGRGVNRRYKGSLLGLKVKLLLFMVHELLFSGIY